MTTTSYAGLCCVQLFLLWLMWCPHSNIIRKIAVIPLATCAQSKPNTIQQSVVFSYLAQSRLDRLNMAIVLLSHKSLAILFCLSKFV